MSAVSIFSHLAIDKLLLNNTLFDVNQVLSHISIYVSFFLVYKLLSTHTAVDQIHINFQKNEILFDYWLFYVLRKEIRIAFTEFSFYTKEDPFLLGDANGIRVFYKNKYIIKLNARNGWKADQIDEILSVFLSITNGETRKKSFN